MTPKKVLDAVYEQLTPFVNELAKYNTSEDDFIIMEFPCARVRFEFKSKQNDLE